MSRQRYEREHQRTLWLLAWRAGRKDNLDYGSMARKGLLGLLGALAWTIGWLTR